MVSVKTFRPGLSNNDVDSISELLEFGADLKAETESGRQGVFAPTPAL